MSFVTKISGTIGRKGCEHCGKAIAQPATGRPKRYCSGACRVAALRVKNKASDPKPPIRANLKLPFEQRFSINMIILDGLFGKKLIEVWHPRYGRGVLDQVRIYGADGEPERQAKLRCLFRPHRWELIPMTELWTLAAHVGLPKHLEWIHPKHREPRKNRLVQMFDSDRNRDMAADCEKWNSDGGMKADAESAVQQMYTSKDRRDHVVDINYKSGGKKRRNPREPTIASSR